MREFSNKDMLDFIFRPEAPKPPEWAQQLQDKGEHAFLEEWFEKMEAQHVFLRPNVTNKIRPIPQSDTTTHKRRKT